MSWHYTRAGFPIRKSPDQSLLSDSPGLIAAGHVLHRLPAPRHPLHALSSLTIRFSQDKKNAACLIVKEPQNLSSPQDLGVLFVTNGPSLEEDGGAGRDRTGDLRLAKPALSQLSYSPRRLKASRPSRLAPLAHLRNMVGLSGFEPLTSRLSGGRSNQLSYRPIPSRSRAGQRNFSPPAKKKTKSGATATSFPSLRSFERR